VGRPIVFLSDLGVRDEFVGACHCVIERLAPGTKVIDLSHGVPAMDVLTGAIQLADGVPYLPPDAVVLAIVDPGVGTDRRAVAVETADGVTLVGPDNGLLSLSWDALGGVKRAVEISSPDVVIDSGTKVFEGRDVFAPAAAWIAAGRALDELGPEVDATSLVVRRLVEPEVEHGLVKGEVQHVDRFGNLRLNVRPSHLADAALGDAVELRVTTPAASVVAARVTTYHDTPEGGYGVLVEAWGWLAVVRYAGRAAEDLQVEPGELVWLGAADG
jgi:S-adenosylmethionine hydrolase